MKNLICTGGKKQRGRGESQGPDHAANKKREVGISWPRLSLFLSRRKMSFQTEKKLAARRDGGAFFPHGPPSRRQLPTSLENHRRDCRGTSPLPTATPPPRPRRRGNVLLRPYSFHLYSRPNWTVQSLLPHRAHCRRRQHNRGPFHSLNFCDVREFFDGWAASPSQTPPRPSWPL